MNEVSPPNMTSATATNTYEGVLILGQDESLLLSIGNAEKLRNQLNECLATAQGLQLRHVAADEVESKAKIVFGMNSYWITNVLMGRNEKIIIQWKDDFGEECELVVPEDFVIPVMELIE